MATLVDLLAAIDKLNGAGSGDLKATSLRMPEGLHQAVAIATELGMAESFTAATTDALASRVRAFARQQALAEHLARFPRDQPDLGAVVRRRVSGTDHPDGAVSAESAEPPPTACVPPVHGAPPLRWAFPLMAVASDRMAC